MDIECICPPTAGGEKRHERDRIDLRPTLGFSDVNTIRMALGVMYTDDPDAGLADVLGVLQERYVLHGIESWTLVDEHGDAVPVTKATIRERLLTHHAVATQVADVADDLYREAVTLPLLLRAVSSSQPGPTDASTSAPNGSSATPRPMPSSPSSISTTPTDDTEATGPPPDGDSRSSLRSVSVA